MGRLNANEKKEFASTLNKLKDNLSEQLDKKFLELETIEINEKLKDEKIDVTLPVRPFNNGKNSSSIASY